MNAGLQYPPSFWINRAMIDRLMSLRSDFLGQVGDYCFRLRIVWSLE